MATFYKVLTNINSDATVTKKKTNCKYCKGLKGEKSLSL